MNAYFIDEEFVDKAEGTCKGIPYNTELASINGVSVHFWMGDLRDEQLEAKLAEIIPAMRNRRDVVRVQYSFGQPTGFWAHEDF